MIVIYQRIHIFQRNAYSIRIHLALHKISLYDEKALKCILFIVSFLVLMYIYYISTEWWDLKNPDEKHDTLPEIWQGHNIVDYIDPDIMEKLDVLEKEEEGREKAGFYDNDEVFQ